jgi:hypothetical protein
MAKKPNLYAEGMKILLAGMSGFDEPTEEAELAEEKEEKVEISRDLMKLIPRSQLIVMMRSPKAYEAEIKRLNGIVENMPQMYETDGLKGRHPLSLHYFMGGCDWYIAEWDREDTFFGYAILNNDFEMSEFGYSSRSEIIGIEAALQKRGEAFGAMVLNLDLYCYDETIEAALFKKNPEYFWKYDPTYPQEDEKSDE